MVDLASAALAWTVSGPAYELTTRQIAMLGLVCDAGRQHHIRELAVALRVSKPVVTRAVNALQALGLVERIKLPEDRRCCLVTATVPGLVMRSRMGALTT